MQWQPVPAFPIPSLDETMSRLLQYCTPLCASHSHPVEELSKLRRAVEQFAKKGELGEVLQQRLQEHAVTCINWLEPFWYDMYLSERNPIPINHNYTLLLETRKEETTRKDFLLVATRLIAAANAFRLTITTKLTQDFVGKGAHALPLCMDQYKRVFGCCRIPYPKRDQLRIVGAAASQHILVIRRSRLYRLDVPDPFCPHRIYHTLRAIVRDADRKGPLPYALGHLTAGPRETWAMAYDAILTSSPENAASMDVVTSALFAVSLDDEDTSGLPHEVRGLHGQGSGNRWYDTSVSFVIGEKSCDAAMVMEHAWGDAHTLTRLCEVIQKFPTISPPPPRNLEDEEDAAEIIFSNLPDTVTATLLPRSRQIFQSLCHRTVLRRIDFKDFGATLIQRQAKVSPDAFLQVCFQVASYRTYGCLRSTYESAMIKVFRHGRTEAMRSVTSEVLAFCEKLCGEGGGEGDIVTLFRKACSAHSRRLEQCKAGKGIQRHLMGLRKMNGDIPLFPAEVESFHLLLTDYLSTSCVVAPGVRFFGFGAVVPLVGLGIGYTRAQDHIGVIVSGWSENEKEVDTFVRHVVGALQDVMSMMMKAGGSKI